eukprot:1179191-Prorocentrum_minimum.AAC.1
MRCNRGAQGAPEARRAERARSPPAGGSPYQGPPGGPPTKSRPAGGPAGGPARPRATREAPEAAPGRGRPGGGPGDMRSGGRGVDAGDRP